MSRKIPGSLRMSGGTIPDSRPGNILFTSVNKKHVTERYHPNPSLMLPNCTLGIQLEQLAKRFEANTLAKHYILDFLVIILSSNMWKPGSSEQCWACLQQGH